MSKALVLGASGATGSLVIQMTTSERHRCCRHCAK